MTAERLSDEDVAVAAWHWSGEQWTIQLAHEVESARRAVGSLRLAHYPVTRDRFGGGMQAECAECGHRYPCETIRAIDREGL